MTRRDIGVPGAAAEAVRRLGGRIAPERLDRIWIFPPVVTGRREQGILAAGCFSDGEGRVLVTLSYHAEETGKGMTFLETYREQGVAPRDRLPGVMEGVSVRAGTEGPGPRCVKLDGDPARFAALLADLSAETGTAR
jgi:hypothetical protein